MTPGDLYRRHTTVDGIGIAWRERSAGSNARTIVFLHGLGASSLDFARVAGHPILAGDRLVLIDAAGFGESDRPAAFAYTIEAHAELVAGLIREVAAAPVALVGHSMDGSTAIALADRHPALATAIVVAEPNLDPGHGTLSGHIARQGEGRFITRGYPTLVYQTERAAARGDAVAGAFLPSLRAASPVAIHRSAVSLRTERSPTFREQLVALRLPRTMLWGAHSPSLDPPLDDAAIRQVTIPNAGHQIMVDNPAAFATAVRETLERP